MTLGHVQGSYGWLAVHVPAHWTLRRSRSYAAAWWNTGPTLRLYPSLSTPTPGD